MQITRARLRRLAKAIIARTGASRTPKLRTPTEDELFRALDPSVPALAAAAAERRRGNHRHAMFLLSEYFIARENPRFFISRDEVPAAAARARLRFPEWQTAVVERSRRYHAGQLDVYSEQVSFQSPQMWRALRPGPGNDKLYCVRPHRFGFAPAIALAAAYRGEETKLLEDSIVAWLAFADDAVGQKYAYSSPLVAVYRIIALTWLPILMPSLDAEFHCTILRVLLADIRYVHGGLGKSFPNNHLLADGFASWYVGFLFPEFRGADKWRRKGEALWLQEFFRQTHADGTSFEHSVHYHEMACEMATAYLLLNRCNGYEVDQAFAERAERMLRFQVDLGGPEAAAIPIGDSTEDPLFPLDSEHGWGTGGLGDLYAALYGIRPFPASNSPSRQRAFWLLGGQLPDETINTRLPALSSYPVGGYHVFRPNIGATRLLFRTGPEAAAPICPGHMHGDLLSIFVNVDGYPFVEEAGTYSYRTGMDPDWRRYLVGPQAHNGLVLPDQDPIGHVEGSFRNQHVCADVRATGSGQHGEFAWASAVDAGSSSYAGHIRGVLQTAEYWLVYDWIPVSATAGAYLHLQLAPDVDAQHEPTACVLATRRSNSGSNLLIATTLASPQIATGARSPLRGWVSRRYGQLEAAPSLSWALDPESRLVATVLAPNAGKLNMCVQAQSLGEHAYGFEIACMNTWSDRIIICAKEVSSVRYKDIQFQGRVTRIRYAASGMPQALNCLDTVALHCSASGIEVQSSSPAQVSVRSDPSGQVVTGDRDKLLSWPG